jgi:NADH-quinone oxidoreductase subunit M
MIQKDVKSLVAYSSVAHLGFVMLGLFAFTFAGMQGGLLQGINHGLTTGALFLLVGMIYERRHTRLISDFGGVAKVMPWFTGLFLTITLASIGLPGTNGFVGEFLALIGMFQRSPFTAVFGVLGIVLAAVYMLWMVKRVFFGPLDKDENRALSDVNRREALVMLPVIVLVFWIGLFPNTFLRPMEPASRAVLARVEAACERARSQEYVEQRGYEEEVQQ